MAEVYQCIYHKDNGAGNAPDDVFIVVNADQAKAYREDSTIALVDVVDSFTVFGTHADGVAGKLSNDDLKRIFGTANESEVAEKIIREGTISGKPYDPSRTLGAPHFKCPQKQQ